MINIMLIGNGFDIQHKILINFNDFVNSNLFKQKIGRRYLEFFSNKKYLEFSNSTNLWSDFEGYLKHIIEKNNLNTKYLIKKITVIFQEWINIKKIKYPDKNNFIQKIIKKHKIDFIISLNYTDTPKMYGFSKKTFKINSLKREWTKYELMKGKFINLHAYSSSKRKIYFILGHDENKKTIKDNFIMEWFKKNKFNPKALLLSHILESNKIINIIVYGFSFGNSDKILNNFLKKFSQNRFVIVYFLDNAKIINLELKDFLKLKKL